MEAISDHSNNQPPPNLAMIENFNLRVRPCLEILDQLRGYGFDEDLHLPAIAVIGDQSVGKSSVLESISGIQLPRGTGIVTRCPLQLQLRNRTDGIWTARISYKNVSGTLIERVITDPRTITKEIKAAQSEMTRDEKEISENPITLTVESEDLIDLSLIDLPGIARYNKQYGSEQVSTLTKNLIRKYIEREEVIILVVVPCHTDIETIEAMALAETVDPQHIRTIGVLTFPDLVNRGSEKSIMDIVNNRTCPLKKGYVMMKCRSQEDIDKNKPLSESIRDEEQFFRSHSHYRTLSKDQYGSRTLGTKLSIELFENIKKYVPIMIREVQEKICTIQQELELIGNGTPVEPSERHQTLLYIFSTFCDNFCAVACGEHRHHKKEERLFALCRKECVKFAQEIVALVLPAGSFPDDSNETPQSQEIMNLAKDFRDYVETEVRDQRGAELPHFLTSYPVCERIVRNKFLKVVQPPAISFLQRVNTLVDSVLRQMAHENFQQYPRLESFIKVELEDLRKMHLERCKLDVMKIFDQEQLVWTQDQTYIETINGMNSRQSYFDATEKVAEKLSWYTTLVSENDNHASDQVMLGVEAYIKIAARRLGDNVPMTVMYHMLIELSKKVKSHLLAIVSKPKRLDPLYEEDISKSIRRQALKEKLVNMEIAAKELYKI